MMAKPYSEFNVFDYLILFGYIEIIFFVVIVSILFLRNRRDKPERLKNYLIGISIFLICFAVNWALIIYRDYFMDFTVMILYPENYNEILVSDFYEITIFNTIWRIATAFVGFGLLVFIIVFELYILNKKTHFILSIIQAFFAIFSLFIGARGGDEIVELKIFLYLGYFSGFVIPIIYFILGARSTGSARRNSFGAGIGFLLLFFGIAFNSTVVQYVGTLVFNIPRATFEVIGSLISIGCINAGIIIYKISIKD